jgi:carbon-monoxide dehydrogenase small subunit
MACELVVNGVARTLHCEPTTLLVDALRNACNLKGTNQACDTAQCGACTVHVNGAAVKSCNVLIGQLTHGAQSSDLTTKPTHIRTIEGVAHSDGSLHPLQRLFSQHHALQCGYCTPGMIMRALALPSEGIAADPQAVREALAGNLCRCTGYEGIVSAIVQWLTAGAPER